MTIRSNDLSSVELHESAEEELGQQEGDAPLLQMDAQRMQHEMQVHRIEIEMENEGLRKMQSDMRELLQLVGDMAEDQLRLHYPGARILLVGAEPDDEAVKGLIESIGLKVDIAGDCANAVELAQRNDYKLILTNMPEGQMDGASLAQALYAIPGREGMPILALDENPRRGLAAGISGYIGKPVNSQRLYAAMLHWLVRSGR